MENDGVQEERVRPLNGYGPKEGEYILYWMQASPRAHYNHALEYAVRFAEKRKKPLLVLFCLIPRFPNGNLRNFTFLLQGLGETVEMLAGRGIGAVVRLTPDPVSEAASIARAADLVVLDRGYLRWQRELSRKFAESVACAVLQVETNAIVPVQTVSDREVWSAFAIRRRIQKQLPRFLAPLVERDPERQSLEHGLETLELGNPDRIIQELEADISVPPAEGFKGGNLRAREELDDFIARRLESYAEGRNDPIAGVLSNMSPYLHFGQISPVYIALRVKESGKQGADAYLEELIVRRELAINFAFYNEHYDSFGGIPSWAVRTLHLHTKDRRPYLYTLAELERGGTHDPVWNAAQREMVKKGKMHGYLRMYWGKKILEWSPSPREAFGRAVLLNDRYELDGRDPNGYAGVAWCFGKHDRPWKEREVFGTVRYMSEAGIRRKIRTEEYIRLSGAGESALP